jgi:hypothetical protein
LQSCIHALLHDQQFLLLFFSDALDFAILGVDFVKQIVNLQLLGLSCQQE